MRDRVPPRLMQWMAVVSVLLLAGLQAGFLGDQPIGLPSDEDVTSIAQEGDPRKQLLLLGMYVANLTLLVWYTRPGALLLLGTPLIILLGWSFASVTWSVLPGPTLRRAVALLGAVSFGLLTGLHFNEDQITRTLIRAAVITVITTLLFTAAFPGLGLDVHSQLRGPFAHKNLLGGFVAIAAIAAIHRISMAWRMRRFRIMSLDVCALVGSFSCLLLSRSGTPILSIGVAVLVSSLVKQLLWSDGLARSLAPGFLTGVIAFALIFGGHASALIAEALGRDVTLSGRTNIWEFVLEMIRQEPLAGYGYGIFWLGESAPGALFWYWTKQFDLHAHNGFLQLALDAGLIGVALFVASILVLFVRLISIGLAGAGTTASWATMFLGLFLITNMAETRLWQGNEPLTAFYVWTVVRVNLELQRLRSSCQIKSQGYIDLAESQVQAKL
ncbi:O-antigen ligase family protein [Roseomonas sp. KE2513]|uniref:O-antigen ligase family protein n=1 Tax=Roseomonas sp. KE2513 TaxID=2479202 RepID=UPI0018DFD2F4|nr:O-antigen ligase [Roseomonas sp. KE2513]MBI0535692.1 O-antigen ligase family protein [Roseomonas sp. KE2513]